MREIAFINFLRNSSIRSCGLLFILMIANCMTGCSSNNNDLAKYIHRIKSRPPKPIEPLIVLPSLPAFKFKENKNMQSPFNPHVKKKQTQPLEAFPLDSLKFVGILKQKHETWALIRQPNKIITHVRVGDYMGKNHGQITVIKNNMIKIKEIRACEQRMHRISLSIGK